MIESVAPLAYKHKALAARSAEVGMVVRWFLGNRASVPQFLVDICDVKPGLLTLHNNKCNLEEPEK
jgi:hypothetical protein